MSIFNWLHHRKARRTTLERPVVKRTFRGGPLDGQVMPGTNVDVIQFPVPDSFDAPRFRAYKYKVAEVIYEPVESDTSNPAQ